MPQPAEDSGDCNYEDVELDEFRSAQGAEKNAQDQRVVLDEGLAILVQTFWDRYPEFVSKCLPAIAP